MPSALSRLFAVGGHTDELLHTERHKDLVSAAGIFAEDAKECLLRERPTGPPLSGK